jgi:hypothetical protein
LPAIVSDLAGLRWAATAGTAVLAPPRRPDELAAAIGGHLLGPAGAAACRATA